MPTWCHAPPLLAPPSSSIRDVERALYTCELTSRLTTSRLTSYKCQAAAYHGPHQGSHVFLPPLIEAHSTWPVTGEKQQAAHDGERLKKVVLHVIAQQVRTRIGVSPIRVEAGRDEAEHDDEPNRRPSSAEAKAHEHTERDQKRAGKKLHD
eukprot:CAMPEP_0181209064 /NCGR_PEP_ID=MMETSP1096-20121128/22461_1 /TAXON_ID=156174 ORGANISM="Chrysochromulina ericina, Strain CCMP281" /NCGR_SAMPLE_ID=MMETSP1096 /ASSEMBLY_ACC=CAM_ASM_000453 /LENGTH=150 /DNA_ID=CAMNT_0023300189 /DNA_START=223 /DNA_END=675 /DNA_ORIENTATION=-